MEKARTFWGSTNGKITLSILLLLLISSGIVYYFMYGSKDAKYTNNAKKVISHINTANTLASSTYEKMNNGLSSLEDIITTINSSEKELNNAEKMLKSINVPSKYKEQNENLANGLKSNKLLYAQANAIIKNYTSDTRKDSITKLYDYLSISSGYYEKFKVGRLTLNYSQDMLAFPDKLNTYIENINKSSSSNYENNNINLFFSSVNSNINELNDLAIYVGNEIASTLNGKKSLEQLTITLYSKKNAITNISDSTDKLKNHFDNSNYPEELKEVETSLSSSINLYSQYIDFLVSFIQTSSKNSNNSNDILKNSLNEASSLSDNFKGEFNHLKSLVDEKMSTLESTSDETTSDASVNINQE